MTATEIRPTPMALLRQEFKSQRNVIAGAIPEGLKLSADRLINLALLAATKSPELLECTTASIVQAVRQAAALGLEVGGPLGEAYIVKYGKTATLIPGYRGYVSLAHRTGKVLDIASTLVYKDDRFEVKYGLNPDIIHIPNFGGSRRDEDIQAAYMVAILDSGIKKFEVMTRAEIDKVRASSRSKDSGPWKDWYPEQAKKTVVRRGAKLLPLSPEFSEAVELENRAEVGTIGAPTRFDTEASISASVAQKTADDMESLKERMGKPKVTVAADPEWLLDQERVEREEQAEIERVTRADGGDQNAAKQN